MTTNPQGEPSLEELERIAAFVKEHYRTEHGIPCACAVCARPTILVPNVCSSCGGVIDGHKLVGVAKPECPEEVR